MPNCQYPSSNHSGDQYTVYHGEINPLHLCGYHATQFNLNDTLAQIRNSN
jgi:hypothetical protein